MHFFLLILIILDAATVKKIEMCKTNIGLHLTRPGARGVDHVVQAEGEEGTSLLEDADHPDVDSDRQPGSVHSRKEMCSSHCQKRTSNSHHRIIGGVISDRVSWYTLFFFDNGDGKLHRCGSSIKLAKKDNTFVTDMLVTAAHCIADYKDGKIDKYETSEMLAYPGIHRIEERSSATMYYIDNVFPHPNFTTEIIALPDGRITRVAHNDVGLVKLKSPVLLTDGRCSVCTAQPNEPPPEGKPCFVIGMGATVENQPETKSEVLKKLQVEVHSHEVCKESGWRDYYRDDEMLCAGPLNPKSAESDPKSAKMDEQRAGPYMGDSGGALYCLVGDEEVMYGVASAAHPAGVKAGYPAIYAHYSEYASWVDKTANDVTSV